MGTITINPNNTVTIPLALWHSLTFQKRYRSALRHIEAIAQGKRDHVPFDQILEESYLDASELSEAQKENLWLGYEMCHSETQKVVSSQDVFKELVR